LCLKCVSEIHIKDRYRGHKPFFINLLNWVPACFSYAGQTAMRTLAILIAFTGAWFPAGATTLQQLGLGEMAQKSTAIARVRVIRANAVLRGTDVYTVYQFETLESLKSAAGGRTQEVAVPGGAAGGIRQVVAGAPSLRVGEEYVIFLWTSRSGWTQIIGLSQGVFAVEHVPAGDTLVTRAAAGEQMLDAAGRPVRDQALAMKWPELKAQVRQALRPAALPSGPLATNLPAGSR
jgi:hypothetical protein